MMQMLTTCLLAAATLLCTTVSAAPKPDPHTALLQLPGHNLTLPSFLRAGLEKATPQPTMPFYNS